MNRAQAIDRFRLEIRQRAGGDWRDADIVSYLEEAQVEVWTRLAMGGAKEFLHWKALTYPGSTYEISLKAYVGERVAKIRLVKQMSSESSPGSTDQGTILPPLYGEVDGMALSMVPISTTSGEVWGYEIGRAGYWCVGDRFSIMPTPTADTYLFIRYTPLPPDLNADDVELWAGELPEWHHVIVLTAAKNAMGSLADKDVLASMMARCADAETRMMQAVGSQRQTQRYPHGRVFDPDGDFTY